MKNVAKMTNVERAFYNFERGEGNLAALVHHVIGAEGNDDCRREVAGLGEKIARLTAVVRRQVRATLYDQARRLDKIGAHASHGAALRAIADAAGVLAAGTRRRARRACA
jgi:hypothetical protein